MLGVCLTGRLKPGCESQLVDIEAELRCKLEEVAWLSGFFSIPPHIQIAGSKAYQRGLVRILNQILAFACSFCNVVSSLVYKFPASLAQAFSKNFRGTCKKT